MNPRIFWVIGSAGEIFLYALPGGSGWANAFCAALAALFALLAVMPSEDR